MKYERRILVLSFMTGFVGSAVALAFLWTSDFTLHTCVTLTLVLLVLWLGFAAALKARVVFPLRTLSNMLGALREGDYSMQVRGACSDDALGEVIWEVNALTELLREQRLGALEATALLRKVMAEIDLALFGFDSDDRLRLFNDSARRLLGRSDRQLNGRHASELGLAECLEGPTPRVVDLAFPGGLGRWQLRRGTYREGGVLRRLVFLSDLTRTLHEEERLAWKRLVQILRHEISNSLAPIQSVAESLRTLSSRHPRPGDWEEDLSNGLAIIADRSEALHRFIESYSKLTHLPPPRLVEVRVRDLIHRVVDLENRLPVQIAQGGDVVVQADQDQLEQLLINVLANAVEASLEGSDGGGVQIHWRTDEERLRIWIEDDGPGLAEAGHVFVPFYTTKPAGSGIGLVLSRQIAEVHGGSLTLENREDAPGCQACLTLPLTRDS